MFMVLAILRIDFFEIENVNFIPLSVIVLVGGGIINEHIYIKAIP